MTDGVEVTLLWSEHDGRLTVTIFDDRTGEFFEVEAPREKALDVFYHPFSYAESNSADAEMGLGTRLFSG